MFDYDHVLDNCLQLNYDTHSDSDLAIKGHINNPYECADFCRSTPSCIIYTWSSDTNTNGEFRRCYLKEAITGTSCLPYAIGRISATKSCPAA